MQQFIDHLQDYGIILDEDRQLYATNSDPSARRETKIKQFKKEKEIKNRITVSGCLFSFVSHILPHSSHLHHAVTHCLALVQALQSQRLVADPDPSSDYELIASLLPSSSAEEEDETDDPEQLRELTQLLLRLCWAKATTSSESMRQEAELLRSMPSPESRGPPPQTGRRTEDDDMWRLDPSERRGGPDGKGPLLDPRGRVRLLSTPSLSR